MHTIQDAQKYELLALIAHAQRVRGDILFKQRQYEQAIQAFECAIADFRNFGMRLECARTLQDYGITLLKITDPTINTALHAHEYLQEARALFMLCHVTPALHMIEHITIPALASSS